jgi:Response regulator containing a CheY-like receiver domain and an HTH DNA-binding domain
MNDALQILLVEDNERLRPAMKNGLENTRKVNIVGDFPTGEEALEHCLAGSRPDAVLMDVQLAGQMNGIEAAIAIRREFPRLPIVFYSIQDEDEYYRTFRRSGF